MISDYSNRIERMKEGQKLIRRGQLRRGYFNAYQNKPEPAVSIAEEGIDSQLQELSLFIRRLEKSHDELGDKYYEFFDKVIQWNKRQQRVEKKLDEQVK